MSCNKCVYFDIVERWCTLHHIENLSADHVCTSFLAPEDVLHGSDDELLYEDNGDADQYHQVGDNWVKEF